MKLIRSLLTIPTLIVAVYSCANAQDGPKIAPLISTRADIEALFGPAEGGPAKRYSHLYCGDTTDQRTSKEPQRRLTLAANIHDQRYETEQGITTLW